jgi:hypothetical protein
MSDERLLRSRTLERAPAPSHGSGRRDRVWRTPAVGPGSLPKLTGMLALALAAIFLLEFLARLPHNIAVLNWDSDYASGYLTIETLVHTGTGGHTLIGPSGQYILLWFGLLTAHLPLHRQLWEVSGTLLFAMTALAVGWTVAQLADRRAAMFAVLLSIVVSPWAWFVFVAPDAHNTVYPCTAVLGGYLVWLARGDGRRRSVAVAVPVGLGVVLGACLASDALNIASDILPLAITALLAGIRRSRRSRSVAVSALATLAVAVVVAKITSLVMHALGYVTLPPTPGLAALSAIPRQVRLLYEGLTLLFNGYLGHPTVETVESTGPLHAALGTACVVIMAAGLLVLAGMATVAVVRLFVTGRHRVDTEEPRLLGRRLFVVYWAGAAAVPCVTFAVGTRTEYVHVSYYASTVFAVAAVVPLLMRAGSVARWLVPLAACVLFAASIVGLTSNYVDSTKLPATAYAGQILAFAKANHVVAGYAGYRDASSLTWSSGEQVVVRPVSICGTQAAVRLCPFFLGRVPSWYVPRRRHSFLLVDAGEPYLPGLPPGFGRPIASYAVGPMRMFVYPYDIVSRFGPPPD